VFCVLCFVFCVVMVMVMVLVVLLILRMLLPWHRHDEFGLGRQRSGDLTAAR
jgi:hypothetical protein